MKPSKRRRQGSLRDEICSPVCAGIMFAIVLVAGVFGQGCKQQPAPQISAAQVHRITQELAKVAATAASGRSVIKTRRASGSSGEQVADELYVGLRGSPPPVVQVQQSLRTVATKYGLTVDPDEASGNTVRLVFRSHGTVTQRIEIEQLGAPSPPASAKSVAGQPRLAILLDDLGNDRTAADAIFALHEPITISVLPFHTHSQEIAEAARNNGCEVMLHLPMQSVADETPEGEELKPGLSPEAVRMMVEKMLAAVPEANGVNNHQGSQATADPALMNELMRVLKEEGVFYVDSRTTAATVAYDAAKREGVPTAFRNVPFLDDIADKNSVKHQLGVAIQDAKQKGEAIAIGHPHLGTLEALREMLPQAKQEGVQLVLVSDLVH
jgi:uncharacterized protein